MCISVSDVSVEMITTDTEMTYNSKIDNFFNYKKIIKL